MMNNAVFGKAMKNVRNHKDVNLAVTKKIKSQKKYLVLEPDCHTRNFLFRIFTRNKNKKSGILCSKNIASQWNSNA